MRVSEYVGYWFKGELRCFGSIYTWVEKGGVLPKIVLPYGDVGMCVLESTRRRKDRDGRHI